MEVFNNLRNQIFSTGRAFWSNASPYIIEDNAIIDPTKMHFGEWYQLIKHQILLQIVDTDLANWWWIIDDVVPFSFQDASRLPNQRMPTIIYCYLQSCWSRGLRLIFGGGVINNCHVVCALDMLTNDVYDVYDTRTCGMDLDEVPTLCAWTNDDAFTLYSHVDRNIYNDDCSKLPITCMNRTRCNTARQLSVHNRSCAYIMRYRAYRRIVL